MYSAERGGFPPVISGASMQHDMSFPYGRESRWLPWHSPSQPATLEWSDLCRYYDASYLPSTSGPSLRRCRYSSGHVTSDVEERERALDETMNQNCRIRIERLSERALSQQDTPLNQGEASLEDSDDSDEEPYKNFKDDEHLCKRCGKPFWEWRLNQDACQQCQVNLGGIEGSPQTLSDRKLMLASVAKRLTNMPSQKWQSRLSSPPGDQLHILERAVQGQRQWQNPLPNPLPKPLPNPLPKAVASGGGRIPRVTDGVE